MPRPSKGPRLYIRKRPGQAPVYVIRDGEAEISTGCLATDPDGATAKLRDYLAEHFRPDTSERRLHRISCAEVLMLYLTDLPIDSPSRDTILHQTKALNAFWGDKSLADVKGSACRAYVKQRTVKDSTARQELKALQAAINHWHRESPLSAVPKIFLPKPSAGRERFLERDEVARMLRACRRLSREGRKAAKGAIQFTDYAYVARFILLGLYTGTRHDAILRLRWSPSAQGGHPDLKRNVLYRKGSNQRETKKRTPPMRLPARLAAHLARWQRADAADGIKPLVNEKGVPLAKMRRAWNTVRDAAGLGADVTPHVLRHTCISWHLWDGKSTWEVGQIVGADAATIDRVYGHHKLEGHARGFVNPKAGKASA